MSSQTEAFDLIVIGAGQGGDPLARAFATAGKTVALIERDQVGGCCVNYGCTPTKTMISHAAAIQAVRDSVKYGVTTGPEPTIDLDFVRHRKDEVVESFRSGTEHHLSQFPSLELIYGSARFIGPKSVEVDLNDGVARALTGKIIVINTGARPAQPSLPGLDQITAYDSTSMQNVSEIPDHLVILGGGNIAVEFGQMFRRFGSNVTLVQHPSNLINHEDPDVSDEIEKIFIEDGIRILKGCKAVGVSSAPTGFSLSLRSYDGPSEVRGSHLMIAIGRTSAIEGLGLESAGIAVSEQGNIVVDEKLATSVPGVYAMGDVTGEPRFTHISYDDFRILKANLLEGASRTTTDRQVPYTMFTDPQISHVGISETEAKKRNLNYAAPKVAIADTARGIETGKTRGFMKAIVDKDTKQILGATIVCYESGELLPTFQTAMLAKLPYTVLKDMTFAHPTQAESINNLFMQLDS